MDNLAVVIPAYKPDEALLTVLGALVKVEQLDVYVVNDGSGISYNKLFEQVRTLRGVTLLSHSKNYGKGRALKTAFEYILSHKPKKYVGVVTADADGQHCHEDIMSIASLLSEKPEALCLGVREMKKSVPLRSRFGNILTRKIFKLILGRQLQDTQTGLRGIPISLLHALQGIKSDGYDFEFDMLVLAIKQGRAICERLIKTIYIDGNESSHFNPIKDSIKIYFVFIRFIALSLVTSALDFVMFALCYSLSSNILVSTCFSRLIAGIFNFSMAKRHIFKSRKNVLAQAAKFTGLVTFLAGVTYGLINAFVVVTGLSVLVSKVLAECILFITSFAMQRLFVFHEEDVRAEAKLATDWDAYYKRPYKAASFTRKVTQQKLVRAFEQHRVSQELGSICELGGANSCFYDGLRMQYPQAKYIVVDNNQVGLDKFEARLPEKADVQLIQDNVLSANHSRFDADVVFSVGLIEHFNPKETAEAIKAHFVHAKKDALVVITFPTPTLLYRGIRKTAELSNQWLFHDERPLTMNNVIREVKSYGEVVDSYINWGTLLTQGVVAVRAKRVGREAREMEIGEV